jgi:hypothetical protein
VKRLPPRAPGLAALGLLLAATHAAPAAANPPSRSFGVPSERLHRSAAPRPLLRPRSAISPTTCSSQYPTAGEFFVGVTAASNVVGGMDGAVLGGTNGSACDAYDGIGAGSYNTIGYNGTATGSFIGAGYSNQLEGNAAFIGAGEANNVGGPYAFDGSGEFNAALASGSFVGAGGYEFEQEATPSTGLQYGNVNSGIDSFVGAGDLNEVTGPGSFIGAGDYAIASSGNFSTYENQVAGTDSFLGAGDGNSLAGSEGFIGSGEFNSMNNQSPDSAIVAGEDNAVTETQAFIGAGQSNRISAAASFIGAGYQNTVSAGDAFIGSGNANAVGSGATYAAIAGGYKNAANGAEASVVGGFGNTAKGQYSTVAGGYGNTADGELSFAAGYHAKATNPGSFVWSDYTSGSALLKDAKANQFLVRASGGTFVYSNEAATSGVELAPGEGTWASLSDRNAKTGIVPLDDASILAKVAALPVSSWRYKTAPGVRHLGPMAQDFYAAFGAGEDDRHIASLDEDGVALAAIKALHRENGRLAGTCALLKAQNARLERRLDALEARLHL